MIEYLFTLEDGTIHRFQVDVERAFDPAAVMMEHPEWTKLGYHQCKNCPLKTAEHPHCPAALDLEQIVPVFQKLISCDKVLVEVRTPRRNYVKHCDTQTGLASLLGVVMASGGCPILSRLKVLAYFHLPFASVEETVFRMAGAYLVGQYFRYKDGEKPDQEMTGLEDLHKQLRILDECFKKRIEATAEQDAGMNALVSLWAISMGVTCSLEDQLRDIKDQFPPI